MAKNDLGRICSWPIILFAISGQQTASAGVRNRHSFAGKGINDETLGAAAKQFGLGKFEIFHQREVDSPLTLFIYYLFFVY